MDVVWTTLWCAALVGVSGAWLPNTPAFQLVFVPAWITYWLATRGAGAGRWVAFWGGALLESAWDVPPGACICTARRSPRQAWRATVCSSAWCLLPRLPCGSGSTPASSRGATPPRSLRTSPASLSCRQRVHSVERLSLPWLAVRTSASLDLRKRRR